MAETMELDPDGFWRMVTQENLKVDGPSAGYMWAGKQGVAGWELYKTRAQPIGWLYQARRVNTQNAVGGGALVTRIQMPSGVTARIVEIKMVGTASAGSTASVDVADEDNNVVNYIGSCGAGASRELNFPSIGTAATAHQNIINSTGLMLGPGEFLVFNTSAGLQTETLTVSVVLLMSANTTPTWDTTGSAGTPALGASTISTANTLQAVYL